LQLLGTGVGMALAGCGGGGDDGGGGGGDGDGGDGDGDGGDGGVNVIDQPFVQMGDDVPPPKLQYNPFGDRHGFPMWTQSRYIFDPFVYYNPVTQENLFMALEDISFDGDTVTITLHDGTWHNGDDIIADDLVTQTKLAHQMQASFPMGNTEGILEDIRATGDRTAEMTMQDAFAPDLTLLSVFGDIPKLCAPHPVFKDFRQRFEDASSDDQQSTVRTDLYENEIPFEEAYGNGPFKQASMGDRQVTLERWPEHPLSEKINWNEIHFQYYEQGDPLPLVQNGTLSSASLPITDENESSIPGYYEMSTADGFGGWALVTNHEDDVFGKRNMRKAIAHIIQNQPITVNIQKEQERPVPPTFSGMNTIVEDEYVGDILDSYITYDSTERAAELLREEGYSKEGGTWMSPDGSPFEPEISTLMGVKFFENSAKTIVSQLDEFGIDASLDGYDASNYFATYEAGKYSLAIDYWGSDRFPNPYFGLRREMTGYAGSAANYPLTHEVPPVAEPDGQPREVNIQDFLDACLTATDEEEFRRYIKELSWTFNQTLSMIPLTQRIGTDVHDTQNWDWPDFDSSVYAYRGKSGAGIVRAGELSAESN